MSGAPAAAGPRGFQRLRQLIDGLDAALMRLAAAMLFAMMLLVVADVALRYLLNQPLSWAYELISLYLMPAVFFLVVSHALGAHAHVAVDILHQRASARARHTLVALGSLVALPAFAFAAYTTGAVTWADWQSGITSSSGLPVPTWSTSWFVPLGFGMLALRLLLQLLGHAGSVLSGQPWLPLPPIAGSAEGAE